MTAPRLDFTGKRVFVTGGATGIGAELVCQFAALGAGVAFNDINESAGEALAARLSQAAAAPILFLRADASDATALQESVADGAGKLGGLDALINNVANDQRETLDDITPETWRGNLAINLDPVMFASKAAVPYLKAAGGGAIVNFSSLNALLGPADLITYTTAKAGIIGLTKSLAEALGPDRIRVNAIIPGWVVTEKQRHLWLTPEAEAEWKAMCALKDDLRPEDVAHLAVFLASPLSRMITGQGFVIDAGRT